VGRGVGHGAEGEQAELMVIRVGVLPAWSAKPSEICGSVCMNMVMPLKVVRRRHRAHDRAAALLDVVHWPDGGSYVQSASVMLKLPAHLHSAR